MASQPRRWSRVAGYAMMAAAGVGAAAYPTPSVQDATGPLVYLWASFLMLGGLLAAAGAATDRWIGEHIGLPLLWAAHGVYAVVLLSSLAPASVVASLALAGFALLLYGRWRDVATVRLEATRQAE
ncbi:hypothetical protein GCM10029963_53060 [Micromonospora andamanensis]|uniref:hypothetical protein n=1 Tax=Micromonospora andamanensis TaxID=1287068 RepID=UPI00194E5044|nr:hypothetical protein [Micromonospora andamanensis]GIJ42637.1 hypothetical protein Vwe01_59620 [Micromonospora andamanensis]